MEEYQHIQSNTHTGDTNKTFFTLSELKLVKQYIHLYMTPRKLLFKYLLDKEVLYSIHKQCFA